MSRDKIVLDMTLRELAQQVNESADGEPYDECFRDSDGQPMTDDQVIARARRIHDQIGEQIVFERPVG